MAAVDDPKAKLTPSQRKRLDEARPYVAVAPKVVRVAGDVPLPDVDTGAAARAARPGGAGGAGGALGAGRARLQRLLAHARRHEVSSVRHPRATSWGVAGEMLT